MANNPKKMKDPTDQALNAIQEVLSTSDQPAGRNEPAMESSAPPREAARREQQPQSRGGDGKGESCPHRYALSLLPEERHEAVAHPLGIVGIALELRFQHALFHHRTEGEHQNEEG